jgi:hypothetical protein
LRLVAQGLSNREIADHLVITEMTVRTHVSSILGKLHLASRIQAALYALRVAAPRADARTAQQPLVVLYHKCGRAPQINVEQDRPKGGSFWGANLIVLSNDMRQPWGYSTERGCCRPRGASAQQCSESGSYY